MEMDSKAMAADFTNMKSPTHDSKTQTHKQLVPSSPRQDSP
jgi:hypothetical protein